ncbi:hypothetical protein JCM24511_08119 [Saitozyma sp. JCM 24511]|nr:hypothetical protein JCM24511_08119 [Saitozyma sp. JCM 24511]
MFCSGAALCSWDNSTRGLDASTALDYAKSLHLLTDIIGADHVRLALPSTSSLNWLSLRPEMRFRGLLVDSAKRIVCATVVVVFLVVHDLAERQPKTWLSLAISFQPTPAYSTLPFTSRNPSGWLAIDLRKVLHPALGLPRTRHISPGLSRPEFLCRMVLGFVANGLKPPAASDLVDDGRGKVADVDLESTGADHLQILPRHADGLVLDPSLVLLLSALAEDLRQVKCLLIGLGIFLIDGRVLSHDERGLLQISLKIGTG